MSARLLRRMAMQADLILMCRWPVESGPLEFRRPRRPDEQQGGEPVADSLKGELRRLHHALQRGC